MEVQPLSGDIKILLTLRDKDVFRGVGDSSSVIWKDRPTGKAVLFNDKGEIALIGNKVHDFLLLPGGGLEDGESIIEGIKRECLEETGCDVEVKELVGVTEEFRLRDGKRYVSHCYFAKTISCNKPSLTSNETDAGVYAKWMLMTEAVSLLTSQVKRAKRGAAKFYNTSFNVVRDSFLINRAQELMSKEI